MFLIMALYCFTNYLSGCGITKIVFQVATTEPDVIMMSIFVFHINGLFPKEIKIKLDDTISLMISSD